MFDCYRRLFAFLIVIALCALAYFTQVINQTSVKISSKYEAAQTDFLHSWMRQRQARLDWKGALGCCLNYTNWTQRYTKWDFDMRSAASKSQINHTDIRPAGQYSHIYIQTFTSNGTKKTIGGDSWRVDISGNSSVAATVFDLNNGTYEALFLVTEPGEYQAKIVLDYSLCEGFIDPPRNWYIKGTNQGGDQPEGTLGVKNDYLLQPLYVGGKFFTFNVSSSVEKFNYQSVISSLLNNERSCDKKCELLWDGFGSWIRNTTWKPYLIEPHTNQSTGNYSQNLRVLHIYGDSLGYLFAKSINTHPICKTTYTKCKHSYLYTYKNIRKFKDNSDYNMERVLNELKEDLTKLENSAGNVMVINYGLHTSRACSFPTYQTLIHRIISLVKTGNNGKPFRSRVIWKTTTSPHKEHFKKQFTSFRFLTLPRVQLFNSFTMSAMCEAGIQVVDVFPLSASYPGGSYDHVHYKPHVFEPLEQILVSDAHDHQSQNVSSAAIKSRSHCVKWNLQ